MMGDRTFSPVCSLRTGRLLAALAASSLLSVAGCGSPTATPLLPAPAVPTATPLEGEILPAPSPTSEESPAPAPSPTAVSGWKPIFPANDGPSPRFDHVTIHDPSDDRLVVFGGRGERIFADTWVYDIALERWSEVPGAGPPDRFGMAAAYEAARNRILLFGGQGSGDLFYNDVWAFNLETLTWAKMVTAGGPPSARYGTSAIVDDSRDRLIISHGFTFSGRFDDTWALNLDTFEWEEITPDGTKPLKRCLHEAVYDAAGDRMLLFGGCSSGFGPCPQGDLWSFHLANHAWTEITPVEGPSPVSNPSLVFDPERLAAILFGGNSSEGPSAQLWRFAG
ncbi:MAG: kelch repeat-containing protein, partial [Anaerolineae bacterium]